MKRFILAVLMLALSGCIPTQIIYKTKVVVPEVPCVIPPEIKLKEYAETMDEEEWDKVTLENTAAFNLQIDLWKRYNKCVEETVTIYRDLERKVNEDPEADVRPDGD